ncbi:MAG: hypothetical protein ACYDHH_28315 [Solirubrobacteraceae bacterium]|jgi:hypothetical protein
MMTHDPADATIVHGDVTYVVIPEQDAMLGIALGLRRAGKPWHSHVLAPGAGCIHNPYHDLFAAVLEDSGARQAYICPSDVFPEVDRVMAKLLHGDDIMDRSKTAAATGAQLAPSGLPERVGGIDARGVAWHHHMCFPGCVLSPRPERWTIHIESDEGEFAQSFDGEPVDVLRELEVLFFAHIDAEASRAG